MELTYRMEGDYRIPNLTVPEEAPAAHGKYALLRKEYLKQHRRILFVNLLTSGKLNEHLAEIEHTAMSRMEQLTAQMAAAQGVTEQMKASDQMKWVGLMNNIRAAAEESVLSDLIYS
ncbi:TnpV protein [Ruminococcaceae bacterium OttesenSCG-928-L11]|nr:TnpV protein [Ruminococcaceae bacterium OttesenSCG-928-L11]